MKSNGGNNAILKIDVEEVLYAKNPSLKKSLPRFIINYLKRIVHQDEINDFLSTHGHLQDEKFIEAGLQYYNIRYKVYGKIGRAHV